MTRLLFLLSALILSACSQDTGKDNPGNECNSTAVNKPYSLYPTDPAITYRYIDANNSIETNAIFGCARNISNSGKRVVYYPTEREVEIKGSPRNFAFQVNELISTSDGSLGGTITLHGYEIKNFPLRLLLPELNEQTINFNIVFDKAVTLFNQFSFAKNQLKTLDFGAAKLIFPNPDKAKITSLMVDLAPILVSPAKLTKTQMDALRDGEGLATGFLNLINFEKNGFPIVLQGSSNWLGSIDTAVGSRTDTGEELETKLRIVLGSDLPDNAFAAALKLLIPDITKIKLVVDITIAQVLVRKVGPVKRNISFSIEGLEQNFAINEQLRRVIKGDSDGDFAVDTLDRAPKDATIQ